MAALRTDSMAYESATRAPGSRSPGYLAELWADTARLRRVAMIWGVAIIASISLVLWLTGGRYVGTDDAYVHAAKLMVSTDVSGLVKDVDVREGEHVKKGQILFRLDPKPFQIALDNAKAELAQSVQDAESTRATYKSLIGQTLAQQAQVNLAQITYNRYAALAKANAIAPTQLDQARGTLQTAQATLVSLKQSADVQLAKLNGNPDLPAEKTPGYLKAQSSVDEMQRQLNHAVVRAPFDGIVTEVDALQPGTLVISAMSAFTTTSAVGMRVEAAGHSAEAYDSKFDLTVFLMCSMAGTLMQALDTTIANVALPYMQGSLQASRDQITWVLTSYIIAAAIMTAPVGWFASCFGLLFFVLVALV